MPILPEIRRVLSKSYEAGIALILNKAKKLQEKKTVDQYSS